MTYMPERPILPGDRPCEPPPPPPACDPCAPVPPPPPGPPPCGVNPFMPPINPVPPVPSPIQGSSLYEQMRNLTDRVNTCINQWNQLSRNSYAALNQAVEVARANDVYYDNCEVHYTEGYDTTEGCSYAIVEKKVVDRLGRPIYMQLVPAYRNSSNPGVTQPIFDASFIESANVIITAVQAGAATWGGPAMWRGNPIPGTLPPQPGDNVPDARDSDLTPIEPGQPVAPQYVYGFTRHGALRYFQSNGLSPTTLVQNGMYNVIGGCTPIIYDGQLLDGVDTMTDKQAITAIGYNSGTGSVFLFSCSAQNQPGMGIASVARVLQGYGCTVAVVTSSSKNTAPVTATEGMLYMGQMTTDPNGAVEPSNLAYWMISKKRFFKNDFQKEIADLIQTTGQNSWKNYLLGVQIQEFDDRILANKEAIENEVNRAVQAETWLQENINKEVNRAMQAEAWLQENINTEVNRATAAEKTLQDNIDAETARATAAEQQLQINITAEETRAKAAEAKIASDLNDEKLRAINRENEIQSALDSEIAKRIAADNDIINSIEQEILARRAADTELRTLIEQEIAKTNANVTTLETTVNNLLNGQTELPYLKLTGGTITGAVNFTANNTITLGRAPTTDMEAATKKYVDDAVAQGGGTTPTEGASKEYVDQQVTNLQTQVDAKVAKAGDSMTGQLNMQGNTILDPVIAGASGVTFSNGQGGPTLIDGVSDPTADNQGANKHYVDSTIATKIDEALDTVGDEYLPTAGGQMTGDIQMTGTSGIKFYDNSDIAKKLARRAGIAVPPQTLKGSVDNVESDMQIKAENGNVIISGLEMEAQVETAHVGTSGDTGTVSVGQVTLNNENGAAGTIASGTNGSINVAPTDGSGSLYINKSGPGGLAQGTVGASTVNLYTPSLTLGSSITQHNGHLDINVSNSQGSVYVNRYGTSGGTGEMYVTEVHAPNELRLTPGTSVNVMNTRIKNVADPTEEQDAVNLRTLKANISGGDITTGNTIILPGENGEEIEVTFAFNAVSGQTATLIRLSNNPILTIEFTFQTLGTQNVPNVTFTCPSGYIFAPTLNKDGLNYDLAGNFFLKRETSSQTFYSVSKISQTYHFNSNNLELSTATLAANTKGYYKLVCSNKLAITKVPTWYTPA